jgi:signal transduction histidine kinase/ligand-binding sensor domain-containing protein/DNA-binding response OmpR family regulator
LQFFKLIVLFILFNTFLSRAQENVFYHYGLENGISQESIRVILKDSENFIWIGTQDGLNRFDGNQFKIYKNDINNPNSISGNYINTLLDDNDKIWIATANNGLCYYDKTKDKFVSVGKQNSNCTSLAIDKHRNIYATYLNNGVSIFSFNNGEINENTLKFKQLKDSKLKTILIQHNKIWIGNLYGDLYLAEVNSDIIQKIDTSKINFESINTIKNIDNSLWLGTDNGIFIFKNNHFEQLSCNSDKKWSINDIIKHNNTYYIATVNGFVIATQFDQKTLEFNKIQHFIGDKNNKNSITSNRVYDLLFDDDVLWIGTNKLDVLSLKSAVFKTISSTSKIKIDNDFIFSIYKTNNYLFIGSRNGLHCIDKQNKLTKVTRESTKNQLAYNVIRGITKDSNNNLWLATTKGISIIDLHNFNPKQPKIKSIYYNKNHSKSLSINNIRSVFMDNKNQIWVATYGGGLNLFTGDLDSENYTFKHFKYQKFKNSISSDFVYSVTQDEDNNYWIATKNGLNKLSFNSNSEPFFKIYNKENGILNSSSILTTYHDKNGVIWIGSQDGFYKYDKDYFKAFGKEQGLTNTVIYTILEDNNNQLWLSTNSGIFMFNKQTEKFTNFSVKDGLQSSEFNLGAAFNDHNTLYFGGVHGVNYFNPNDIDELYQEGDLVFTSLKVKGNEIHPDLDNKILTKNIVKSQTIQLNFDDFPSYLSFSDLNYNLVKNSEFVYKLIPNDANWNKLYNRKEIQLLNLSSGTYKLQVQGKSNGKIWNKKPLEITIIVSSVWYKSNIAYLIYGLLLLGLVFLFYHFQLDKKIKSKEVLRLKELDDLKTKLYANITHEFRTPITVILGMAEVLKEELINSSKKVNSSINLIEKNSDSLLNLVNQLLDLAKLEEGKLNLNIEKGDVVKYLKYITESYVPLAKDNQINLVFYNEVSKVIMDFDYDKLALILKNLITNAIKFCDKNEKVIVHVSKIKTNLVIKVKDTGIGISNKHLPFIFDRFYQVENASTKKYDGTGIGLALTKELVHLMNGNIKVESQENVGTTFIMEFTIINNQQIESKDNSHNQIITKKITTIESNIEIKNLDSSKPIALVVEDHKDVANYILLCLEKKYQTISASSGNIGIELAKKHIPDIIISDIMMPKVDGYELLETLKNDEKTNHIPIILLTAKTNHNSKITGLDLGADAYLTKPFKKDELLIRIKKLINLRKILHDKYAASENLIIKPTKQIASKNEAFIQKVITEINKNIKNVAFNSTVLAENLFLSESQLYRKLKALTNTSTALFIRKIRLQKAKTLLETTNKSVSEICYETGFNEPSWFTKVFKQEFGYLPSEHR